MWNHLQRRVQLKNILEKDIPIEEKVNRLMSVESETMNAEICDYVVKYESDDETARNICESLGIEW